VRDAYEVISFVERELPKSPAAAAAVLAAPATAEPPAPGALPRPEPTGPVEGPFLLSFLELGGGLSLGTSTRALGTALLGVARGSARSRYELGLGARLSSRQHETREDLGRISVSELGPLLSARMLWRRGRVEVGGALTFYLAFAWAEGVTADGSTGRSRPITPVLGLGPDLRVRMFRFAYLRFAPSLELATIRQRYALDQQVMVDAGWVSVSLPFSLLVTLPLRNVPESFQP